MGVGKFANKGTASGGGTYTTTLREYTASGTWTKPSGLLFIEVLLVGGGGGGGSGARMASGVITRGGGGAGAGGCVYFTIDAASLGSTVDYTVGAGGTGGAGRTVDATSGVVGGAGGQTLLTGFIAATGGLASNVSTTTADTNGAVFGAADFYQVRSAYLYRGEAGATGQGQNALITGASQNSINVFYLVGGGSGAGISFTNTAFVGGNGTRLYNRSGSQSAAVAGGAIGGNGTNGVDQWYDIFYSLPMASLGAALKIGTSGAGGGSSTTAVGGNGGNGGIYGGAGGGGGSSRNGFTSGAGGNGGGGCIIIVEHTLT